MLRVFGVTCLECYKVESRGLKSWLTGSKACLERCIKTQICHVNFEAYLSFCQQLIENDMHHPYYTDLFAAFCLVNFSGHHSSLLHSCWMAFTFTASWLLVALVVCVISSYLHHGYSILLHSQLWFCGLDFVDTICSARRTLWKVSYPTGTWQQYNSSSV